MCRIYDTGCWKGHELTILLMADSQDKVRHSLIYPIIQYSVWGHFYVSGSVLNVGGWVWEVFNKIKTLPLLSLHLNVKD